jgi:hypothetical protein
VGRPAARLVNDSEGFAAPARRRGDGAEDLTSPRRGTRSRNGSKDHASVAVICFAAFLENTKIEIRKTKIENQIPKRRDEIRKTKFGP